MTEGHPALVSVASQREGRVVGTLPIKECGEEVQIFRQQQIFLKSVPTRLKLPAPAALLFCWLRSQAATNSQCREHSLILAPHPVCKQAAASSHVCQSDHRGWFPFPLLAFLALICLLFSSPFLSPSQFQPLSFSPLAFPHALLPIFLCPITSFLSLSVPFSLTHFRVPLHCWHFLLFWFLFSRLMCPFTVGLTEF